MVGVLSEAVFNGNNTYSWLLNLQGTEDPKGILTLSNTRFISFGDFKFQLYISIRLTEI